MAALEIADQLHGSARLADRAADLAGRGEVWLLASSSDSAIQPSLLRAEAAAGLDRSAIVQALAYRGARGHWLAENPTTNDVVEWRASNAVSQAQLAVLQLGNSGNGQHLQWTVTSVSSNACFRYLPGDPSGTLLVDENCDGAIDSTITTTAQSIAELAPSIVSVLQDGSVLAGRPLRKCVPAVPAFPENYGTVLAVLFSKPMTQEKVNVPSAYTLENGNVAGSVQIQAGGRVALLNMRRPLGAIVPRTMSVSGLTDPRGHAVSEGSRPVESDLGAGIAIRGRVVRADGSPAAGVPVTLTMYDQTLGFDCESFTVRVSQAFSDENGYFDFDFVMSGIPYSVSATDTGALTAEQIQLILDSVGDDRIQAEKLLALANSPSGQDTLLGAFALGSLAQIVAKAEGHDRALLRDVVPVGSPREGTTVPVALRFRGRGVVTGQVLASDATTPVS